MKPGKLFFAFVCAFAPLLTGGLWAQAPATRQSQTPPIRFPELPQASPACTNMQRIGLTEIKIVYSRPSKRRHAIFGGIVPEDDIWRTGDNASTKITFSTPVKMGGATGGELPAGEYALYTIPDEKEWTVIISKDTGLWGKEGYDPKNDMGRIKVAPVKLADPVETFTIDLNDIQDDSATLNLSWDRVRIPIKLEFEIVSDLVVRIKAALDSSSKKGPETYLRAATFYFDHTKDLAQALLWVDTGLASHPPITYQLLYLKAKILAKQGDRNGATEAANESMKLAREVEGVATSYNRLNYEVIQSLR